MSFSVLYRDVYEGWGRVGSELPGVCVCMCVTGCKVAEFWSELQQVNTSGFNAMIKHDKRDKN